MKVCLYGPTIGHGSFVRVAAGLSEGLAATGALADFVATDGLADDDGALSLAGAHAPVGLYVGPPSGAGIMVSRGEHARRLVMLAPNSSWLPEAIRMLGRPADTAAGLVTGFVSPSAWGAEVIRRHVPDMPVSVYRHGISPAVFRPTAPQRGTGDAFRVLHMTSTAFERKGTRELVAAWTSLRRLGKLGTCPELLIVADHPMEDPAVAGVTVRSRMELSLADAAKLYRRCDCVCQPSRGEGFGLVPLEARAAGVPVVMTSATGHAEHASRIRPGGELVRCGVVEVGVGEDAPIDDGPDALAPKLEPAAVAEALERAYEERHSLHVDALLSASAVRRHWSWRAVTADWLAEEEGTR